MHNNYARMVQLISSLIVLHSLLSFCFVRLDRWHLLEDTHAEKNFSISHSGTRGNCWSEVKVFDECCVGRQLFWLKIKFKKTCIFFINSALFYKPRPFFSSKTHFYLNSVDSANFILNHAHFCKIKTQKIEKRKNFPSKPTI